MKKKMGIKDCGLGESVMNYHDKIESRIKLGTPRKKKQ